MKVFILEDDAERIRLFRQALHNATTNLTIAETMVQAQKLWNPPYDVCLLDHDLGESHYSSYHNGTEYDYGTGYDFVQWAIKESAAKMANGMYIVHSYNSDGAIRMCNALQQGVIGAEVYRQPFGPTVLSWLMESGLKG